MSGPLRTGTHRLLRSREHFFWLLHVLGWTSYEVVAYLGALVHDRPASYVVVVAAEAISGLLLSLVMRFAYRELWNKPPLVRGCGARGGCDPPHHGQSGAQLLIAQDQR